MAASLYGIVDTARDRQLYELVSATAEHVCLFAGQLKAPLERVAPYLVRLSSSPNFAKIWQNEWGQSWGILCVSVASLEQLRLHFRQFLQAKLPDGQIALFRFYDPRVFRIYLPTCDLVQLRAWFACAEEFRVEAAGNGKPVVFRLGANGLIGPSKGEGYGCLT